ncbi:hypothetical protein [Burkholderia sola]
MSHDSCGMRATRLRPGAPHRQNDLRCESTRKRYRIRMKHANFRTRADNVQHANLPRKENPGGNELKQSVTKRNYT